MALGVGGGRGYKGAAATSGAVSGVARRVILLVVDVPDSTAMFKSIGASMPAAVQVGVGATWSAGDRLYSCTQAIPDTLDDMVAGLNALVEKIPSRSCGSSLDIVLLLGSNALPAPESAPNLFIAIDTVLSESRRCAGFRIVALGGALLNDWDILLGAHVTRVSSMSSISLSDLCPLWSGNVRLVNGRVLTGVTLTRVESPDQSQKKVLHAPTFPLSKEPLQVVSRVDLRSIPPALFRRAPYGRLHSSNSRGETHQLLSFWANGRGIMADSHGLLLKFTDGPTILCFPDNETQSLRFRTFCSSIEEEKLSGCGMYSYIWQHHSAKKRTRTIAVPPPPMSLSELGAERTRTQILLENAPLDVPQSARVLCNAQLDHLQSPPADELAVDDPISHGIEYCNDDSVQNDGRIGTLHRLFLPAPHRRIVETIAPLFRSTRRPCPTMEDSLLTELLSASSPAHGEDRGMSPDAPVSISAATYEGDELRRLVEVFLAEKVPVDTLASASEEIVQVIERARRDTTSPQ